MSATTTPSRRVLVPYDGSAAARRALARAADLARPDDEVTILNVMPEPGISARLAPFTEERAHQARLLAEATRLLAGRGVEARPLAACGGAVGETLEVARRLPADVIVVGGGECRRMRSRRSTADRIARRAPCDVLLVHDRP